jgi:hypothetical protein
MLAQHKRPANPASTANHGQANAPDLQTIYHVLNSCAAVHDAAVL